MFTLAGILLLMIGASLVFAVERQIEGIDLQLVGWIMMAGGLAALLGAIVRFARAMNDSSSAARTVDSRRVDHRSDHRDHGDGALAEPARHEDDLEDDLQDHGRHDSGRVA